MHETLSLEHRVAALEAEVADLKKRLEATESLKNDDWIQKISGSFKGDPEFGEILRLGAEIRRADRPEEVGP